MGTLMPLGDDRTRAREAELLEQWMNPPEDLLAGQGEEDPLDALSGFSLVRFHKEEQRVEFIADGELRLRVSAQALDLPWYPGSEPDYALIEQVHQALRGVLLNRAVENLYRAGAKQGNLKVMRDARNMKRRWQAQGGPEHDEAK